MAGPVMTIARKALFKTGAANISLPSVRHGMLPRLMKTELSHDNHGESVLTLSQGVSVNGLDQPIQLSLQSMGRSLCTPGRMETRKPIPWRSFLGHVR